jgi:hypothetical protein
MGNLFSSDLSNYDPSILRGSLLAVGDTVVAAHFCCRKARLILQEFLWLVQEKQDCQGTERTGDMDSQSLHLRSEGAASLW